MTLLPVWSTTLSLLFLVLGGVALYTMLVVRGRGEKNGNPRALTRYHRWSGWLFILLFLFLFILMITRIEDYWEESSARIALHVTMAVALFFLLALKVLVARFFPKLMKHLFQLGATVYLLAFTLVWITAGYYLIWRYEEAPYLSHTELPEHMLDLQIGKQIFIQKCSTCHLLRNIMRPRSAESWEEVVNRMIKLAEPRITPGEGGQILHYLTATHTPEARKQGSIPEKYCLPCHSKTDGILDREYSRARWRQTVLKMREYGPEIIPPEKVDEIATFLAQQEAEKSD